MNGRGVWRRCAGVYGRCCKYKIDIAYNFRPLQSGFAGAKILDYYKSVITGSGRGRAPVIGRTGRIAFTIVNEAYRFSYLASRFSIALATKITVPKWVMEMSREFSPRARQ